MEAQDTFNFELVSPEEKLISAPAKMVVIPGEEGDFGVLPNHAATISSIRPGVIEIFSNDNEAPQRIFIAGGFADVSETNCTVLAEEAVNVKDLNKDDLEQTIRNLTEDMTMAKDDADLKRIEHKLVLAKAKLSAVIGGIVI
ncbi:MAG: ATP synthase F1 subunit epsilon [Rhodospirillales bacterium]|nr:ATP synthase F1 subunit epsilon [Rhodospirillales bacterium]MCB9995090.1 ATP synthase F1 subunit epsilon [Rhodospirillales bacterium]